VGSDKTRKTGEPKPPSCIKNADTNRAQIVKEKSPKAAPAGTGSDPKVTPPKHSDTTAKRIKARHRHEIPRAGTIGSMLRHPSKGRMKPNRKMAISHLTISQLLD